MYLTRGQPVVYYGDEQGFTGAGGDQDARQDMFASQVADYNDDDARRHRRRPAAGDRFDTDAPALPAHRRARRAARGATRRSPTARRSHRYAADGAGIYAFSRIDAERAGRVRRRANNATTAEDRRPSRPTRPTATFAPSTAAARPLRADADGRVTVTVPPLSVAVVPGRRDRCAQPKSAPAVYLDVAAAPAASSAGAPRSAPRVPGNALRRGHLRLPAGRRRRAGRRSAPTTTRRTASSTTSPAWPRARCVEYRAVAKDAAGNVSATSTYGIVGEPRPPAAAAAAASARSPSPTNVSVPGSHNSEMGCPGDWQPDCDAGPADPRPEGRDLEGHLHAMPAGDYDVQGRDQQDAGTRTTAPGGVAGRRQHRLHRARRQTVTFYYDHAHALGHQRRRRARSSPLPGSYQSELGCAGDWAPDCMRVVAAGPRRRRHLHLHAPTRSRPAATRSRSRTACRWDENYGAGGARTAPTSRSRCPADGVVTTISYDAGDPRAHREDLARPAPRPT